VSFSAVQVRAPAKLTVSLRVTGVRADGFHLIDAEMVTVDLADELTIAALPNGSPTLLRTRLDGPARAGLAVSDGPDNLIRRALAHVGRSAEVTVHKRIPAGGGLGGGSANAAAILRWAGHTAVEQVIAAASLGADVPFCILGGRANVRGIGELIDPLSYESRTYTLLTPSFGVSTPAVYRAWDALGGPHADGPNDLEAAALAVEPRLVAWRDRLQELTGATPVLAGSGSTWFVVGSFPSDPADLDGDGRDDRVVVTTTRSQAS
jgi:4-diphosphocytidyl-2-C-methyl-D-erythritol kinase